MKNESEQVEISFQPEANQRIKKSVIKTLTFIIIGLIISIYGIYKFISLPPTNFPLSETMTITPGSGVAEIASLLKEKNLIRSELLFRFYIYLTNNESLLKASTYTFEERLNLSKLTEQLVAGDYSSDLIKVTHIEGERVEQLAAEIKEVLPNFDTDHFILIAKPHEGKLFPETYFIPSNFTPEELLTLLLSTFTEKTNAIQEKINNSELSLDEVIILASIIEREANTPESQKIVSGILQKRLVSGMPLQVDASIEYVLNKPLSNLLPEDLEIDSPYNTYLNFGLPPTPIGNPGIDAILAVLEPTPSDYLFYITGKDGNFYYARNFDEHKLNIARYLR